MLGIGCGPRHLVALGLPFARRERHETSVGEARHEQSRQLAQRCLQIERARERGAGLGEQREPSRRAFCGFACGLFLDERDAFLRLPFRLLGQQKQFDEHPDLRPQNLRHHRRRDVIDCAEGIRLRHPQLVAVIGGHEDDRCMRGLLAAANQRRRLEAVEPWHVDVEQDQREIALQYLAQRLVTGRRRVQVLVEFLEQRPVDQQLVRPVVDDEDVGAIGSLRNRWRGTTRRCVWSVQVLAIIATAIRAGIPASARCRPAWTDNPMRRLPCTSRDRLSSPLP